MLNLILYADDSSALATGNGLNNLIENINQELVNMFNWFEANQLPINFGKCSCVILRRQLHLPREIRVTFINDIHIE